MFLFANKIKIWLIISAAIVIIFPSKSSLAAVFEVTLINEIEVQGTGPSLYSPSWLIKNLSADPLLIGAPESMPLAAIDFGSLPVNNPSFGFYPEAINGYVLALGESVGSFEIPSIPFPDATYTSPLLDLFTIDGDFVAGDGSGYLYFGFGPATASPLDVDHVKVPLFFDIKDGNPQSEFGYEINAFSSGAPVTIPEPATAFMLASVLVGLFVRRNLPPEV